MKRKTIRTDRARASFLAVFSETCNVSEACRAANIGRSAAYAWRNDDAEFAADWDDAEQAAVDALEKVAWDRAKSGQSDRMLEILLKAHRPDKFVERSKIDMNVSGLAEEIEAARKRSTGK